MTTRLDQIRPTTTFRRAIVAATLALAFASMGVAADAPPGRLPDDVARLVDWLPEDTETLSVARSFRLDRPGLASMSDWSALGEIFALADLEFRDDSPLASIAGRRVKLGVRGGRRFDVVTSFGGLRGEGCAIYSLESPLDKGGKPLADLFLRRADEVLMVGGRDIFAFPSMISEEPWIKRADWEGAFFVIVDPSTLLYATSERYLVEVLDRIDRKGLRRALPDSLPEWRHLDANAPSWLLRHYPRVDPTTRAVGMTVRGDGRRLRVAYVAPLGAETDRDRVEEQWTVGLDRKADPQGRFRVDRQADGSTLFATDAPPPRLDEDLGMWIWQVTKFEAMDVAWEGASTKP